jgi:hypothetical protein
MHRRLNKKLHLLNDCWLIIIAEFLGLNVEDKEITSINEQILGSRSMGSITDIFPKGYSTIRSVLSTVVVNLRESGEFIRNIPLPKVSRRKHDFSLSFLFPPYAYI